MSTPSAWADVKPAPVRSCREAHVGARFTIGRLESTLVPDGEERCFGGESREDFAARGGGCCCCFGDDDAGPGSFDVLAALGFGAARASTAEVEGPGASFEVGPATSDVEATMDLVVVTPRARGEERPSKSDGLASFRSSLKLTFRTHALRVYF